MKRVVNKILKPFGLKIINAAVDSGWRALNSVFGNFKNAAREQVNNSTALTVSSVFAAIRNISEDVAKMPLKVYRKDGQSKFEESKHPAYRLLQYQSNPEVTAMALRETLTAHAMGWGNGYAYIERNYDDSVRCLRPIHPSRVRIFRDKNDKLYYEIKNQTGGTTNLWPREILHIHGIGDNGISGINIIQYMAESIASGIAMDKFASSFFGNGLNQSGSLKCPTELSQGAQERLAKQLDDKHTTAAKSHKTFILEMGMEWIPNSLDPKASQMIESRQFSVTEFCRWLRIQPHKLAELSKSAFSNIEEQNIDYVTDSLTPWCKRWEQELWIKLLSEKEQNYGYYFEHNIDGLLRGNTTARYESYSSAWDRGIMSINEIRAKENMNPIPGGDQHFVPMNFVSLNQAGQMNNLIDDAAQRIYMHGVQQESTAKDKHGDNFDRNQFDENFKPKHDKYVEQVLKPFGLDITLSTRATVNEIRQIIRGALCQK